MHIPQYGQTHVTEVTVALRVPGTPKSLSMYLLNTQMKDKDETGLLTPGHCFLTTQQCYMWTLQVMKALWRHTRGCVSDIQGLPLQDR